MVMCVCYCHCVAICVLEYVEYTDGSIAPASSVINANVNANANANTAMPVRTVSPVNKMPGKIADYDPITEARPSPYSARQAATTVIYTSDKGAGMFCLA